MSTAPSRLLLAVGRLLGVVLVLVGIVAMHQLAGGEHMAMGAAGSTAGSPAVGQPAAPADGHMSTGSTPVGGSSAPLVTAHHQRAGDPALDAVHTAARAVEAVGTTLTHPAMPTCLAVLAALLLAVANSRGRLLPGTPVTLPLLRPVTTPLGRGPPRALLAQICVLRT